MYKTYEANWAYHVALGLVGSHDDALDLSQDAFVRAFRARRTLAEGRLFYPWYYQILRRLCFNHLRDTSRRADRLASVEAFVAREADDDPAREVERRETRRRCRAAIAELPDTEREVLVFREYHGLKYREVADLLEIPIGTVMSRLYSARRRIAQTLDGEA